MEGMRLRYLVACLIFIITIHTFYEDDIHAEALRNHTTPCLRVGVPWKRYYTEFVSSGKNGTNPTGFCVEVFKKAIQPLNCTVEYITFGDGVNAPPSYDELIQLIVDKEIDAVVGDITITANRSQKVEFTQPFLDASLVAVVRLKDESFNHSALIFMKPFSTQLWLLVAVFFVCGGLSVYLLERQKNPSIPGNPASGRFGKILMFGFSTWFPQEDTRSVMGRTVSVTCLLVTGILYSCYTANLSAILTTRRLQPMFGDLQSVLAKEDIRIGYWSKSFTRDFLLTNEPKIQEHRLVSLTTKADYYNNLSSGGVDAIIDERPHMQSLVANYCNQVAFAGQPLTISLNWGFAFDPSHHQLAKNISRRILQLTETGELYESQKRWLPYYERDCSAQSMPDFSQLQARQIWGLFAMSGFVTIIVLIANIVRRSRFKKSTETKPGISLRTRRRTWPRRLNRNYSTISPKNSTSMVISSENSIFEEIQLP